MVVSCAVAAGLFIGLRRRSAHNQFCFGRYFVLDQGYGRGITFWASIFSDSGPLARLPNIHIIPFFKILHFSISSR